MLRYVYEFFLNGRRKGGQGAGKGVSERKKLRGLGKI